MDLETTFQEERKARISDLGQDASFQKASQDWMLASMRRKYPYNFSWMGRPIIQTPMDIIGMQELLWDVQPDLLIETGVAHGGSLICYASLLELNAISGGPANAKVLGIDIDIRSHNRAAIEKHPMSKRIELIQGSSIAPAVIEQVKERAKDFRKILLCLDSNHTHEHVLQELNAYAELVSMDSYCVVFDTFVEDMPKDLFPDRPWGPGDNPKTAVHEFLRHNDHFVIEAERSNKLMITVAPDGFLRRIR